MMTVIVTIIVGLIIGACARFILPGRQNINLIVTCLIGIVGAFAGSYIATNVFNYSNANGGIAWIPFFIGVAVAAGLILLYGMITGRRV